MKAKRSNKNYFYAALFLLLIILPYFSYRSMTRLREAYDYVNHTNVVKLKLQETALAVVNAETGQRGFLLTRDSTYLTPYCGAADEARETVKEIDSLTADNPIQKTNCHALAALINERFNILNWTVMVSLRDRNELKSSLDKGKIVTDNISELIDKMNLVEDDLLKKRIEKKEREAVITPLYSMIVMIGSILIIIFSFWKIRQHSARLAKMNQELQEQDMRLSVNNKELEMMNKELASFSYIASHDLKEPLRKILTFANRIVEKETLTPKAEEYFSRITSAAARMQQLIDALLNLSRTTNSDAPFKPTDLNKIMDEVLKGQKDVIEEKKAEINVASLPVINAVDVQMQQLFMNLISNALKYSKKEMTPVINVKAEKVTSLDTGDGRMLSGKWLKLTFEDNGIGFEQQFEHKIFELFQRLHGKSEYEGTGIGLAICKKIAANHKGAISAVGKPGEGSVFTVHLSEEL